MKYWKLQKELRKHLSKKFDNDFIVLKVPNTKMLVIRLNLSKTLVRMEIEYSESKYYLSVELTIEDYYRFFLVKNKSFDSKKQLTNNLYRFFDSIKIKDYNGRFV